MRDCAALRVVLLGLLEREHRLRVHPRHFEGLARLVIVVRRLERIAVRQLRDGHLSSHLGGRQILVRLRLHRDRYKLAGPRWS